jgi:hypothetical protein
MRAWVTVIESVWERWRSAIALPERRRASTVSEPRTGRVPAEYLSLYTYLEHRYAAVVVLTFEQMEALLGFALPLPASSERDWWTGAAVRTDRHSDAWVEAGRTATPNLRARTVTFERQRGERPATLSRSPF